MSDQSSQQQPEQKTEVQATPPPLVSFPPHLLDLSKITDNAERERGKEIITQWVDAVIKEVHQTFAKHGVETFQICFVHKGSKTPVSHSTGSSYTGAKLAATARNEFKARLDQELE